MPDPSPMSWLHAARAEVGHWQRRSWAFALMVVLGYGLATLPILVRHQFDPSAFIIAGDHFVDTAQLASPIIVQHDSNGYDGEFYYRLALSPFQMQQPAFGIRFDNPSYRMQRIGYPLLVWVITLGHAAAVPAAMYLVNLLGLAAIAIFATRLTARLRLFAKTPLAIMLWPGFIIALTHDTTEIVAAALVVAALDSYFAKCLVVYGVLGALATLTRETIVLVLCGVACFEAIQAIRTAGNRSRWHRTLVCGLALVPLLVWQAVLHLLWGRSPQAGTGNLGSPFLGAVLMLRDTLIGAKQFVQPGRPVLDAVVRAYVLASAGWLLGFCAIVAVRVPVVLRMAGTGALAASWLPVFALMSLLTAGGPWVDRNAYFRAFTECYVVGCLVLGVRPPPRWLTWLMFAGGTLALLGAWVLSAGEK
ncbi:MAG TPA: hypothetical protein VGL95_12745 [Acetobacteraceae bacterium]